MQSEPTHNAASEAPERQATLDAAGAVDLLVHPRRAVASPAEGALLDQARRFDVRSDGRPLAAWTWGKQGPTVLLVHGWDSRASHLGLFVEMLLQSGYRVIAFDAPGHGDSAGAESNVVDLGRSVLDVADRLGPFDAAIAHSVGSPACLYAFAHGLRVHASVHLAGPSSLKRAIRRFGAMCRLDEEQCQQLDRLMAERIGVPLEIMDLDNLAPGLIHPALLLHDPEDREVPFAESEALHAAWPKSALRPVPGVGHRRILRETAVAEASVGFITEALRTTRPAEPARRSS